MGFCLQLRLLLWKNYTLKKRRPFVLLFEIFIPLVLFFIVIGIRKKQPAMPVKSLRFSAFPLPSAGVISIMQSFCDNGQRDEDGFNEFPNSTVSQFLKQLNNVALHHNFFEPTISLDELNDIPRIYQSIIEDPVAIRDHFRNVGGVKFMDLFLDPVHLEKYLVKNLSFPYEGAAALFNSSVDTEKVYNMIFYADDPNDMLHDGKKLSEDPSWVESTDTGIIFTDAFTWKWLETPDLIAWVYSIVIGDAVNPHIQPEAAVKVLKMVLFSPQVLKSAACNNRKISNVVQPTDNSSVQYVDMFQERYCSLNNDDSVAMSKELIKDIDDEKIITLMRLREWNVSLIKEKCNKLERDIHNFHIFKHLLEEMSALAAALPQDACLALNSTDSVEDEITTSSKDKKQGDKRSSPGDDNKSQQQYGLLRIWLAMQKTVCGKETMPTHVPASNANLDPLSLDNLGISESQKNQIGILVHVLYCNPKVLYAPNDTDADKIIQKANQTFVMLDTVTQFASNLLNVSAAIREFLSHKKADEDLAFIQEMQKQLRRLPLLLKMLNDPVIGEFVNEAVIPNKTIFLQQLDVIDNAACSWIALMSGISLNVFQGFKDEESLIEYFQHDAYSDNVTVLASVIFQMNNDGSMPRHMTYTIRQNASFTITTSLVRNRFWFPGPRNWGYNYYQFGFVWIQDILERAMINIHVGRDVTEPGSYVHQFPYPCYMEDQFLFMIEHVMPLCLTISWVYSVSMLVQYIVYEKEQRLKEVMKMMGLTNGVHWVAWFITNWVQMTIPVLALTVILKYGHILTYSDPFIIFFVLEIFAIANIMFSFLVSVLYSKAKLAAACAGIIYFLSYVPYMYIAVREEASRTQLPVAIKFVASLLSTTAFGLGAKYFAFYEEIGVGVQWSNMAISPVEDDRYNLKSVVIMMIVDIFVYTILMWYIENVHPGAYGLPKAWYFPFTRSYWYGTTKSDADCTWWLNLWSRKSLSLMEEDQANIMENRPGNLFETEPTNLPLGVCIDKLTKVYKNGGKVAVNRLSLKLYESQITCILGHNGAGKTTTMSILTGLFPPTSGHAMIYGQDIRTEMDHIRKSLGLCPQHNVLFDELTVEEHLWFYARLKGMSSSDIRVEMEKLIEDVGLPLKRNNKADCLSGGMKRKLSVAIAFVGGSRLVILDEPTAGVDPYSRRAIWDLIVKYKQDRTILLSSHHMDEADILSDRVAILANGQLRCCGSSLYLKNQLGNGYHLCMVKKPTAVVDAEDTTSTDSGMDMGVTKSFPLSSCSEAEVTEFIRKYVPTASLATETNHELHYLLPTHELRLGNFQKLFAALEEHVHNLHITSYGTKNTTLEEVFLKVADQKEDNECDLVIDSGVAQDDELLTTCDSSSSGIGTFELRDMDCDLKTTSRKKTRPKFRPRPSKSHNYEQVPLDDTETLISEGLMTKPPPCFKEGCGTYRVDGKLRLLQQFFAILHKRYLCTKRNWKGLFAQILLPAFFVCIAMSVALTAPQVEDLPPLVLSPSQYYNFTQPNGNVIPFSNQMQDLYDPSWTNDAVSSSLESTFHLPSGVGATCVLESPLSNFHLDQINLSVRNFQLLSDYFESSCQDVFVPGLPLENFVPPLPTSRPAQAEGSDSLGANSSSLPVVTTANPSVATSPIYYPTCHCSKDSTGFVCSNSGYEMPPSFKVVTGDILMNITGQNEHEYYLYTTDMFRLRRYGALTFGIIRKFVPENFGHKAPPLFRKIAVRAAAKIWYNHKGYHSMPTYVNTLNNAILRANLPSEKGPSAYGITVINHPMTDTNYLLSKDRILQGTDVLIAIFIIAAMSFVPASFVLFLVYERFTKAKHLQMVSGVNPIVYWVANYFWDMCNYVVPAICCVFILLIFDIPAYVSHKNFPAVVSLFLLYGWSITPVMYPASFLFKEPSSAYIFLIVINLFVGITCVVTSFLLEVFSSDKYLGQIHQMLKGFFLMFPNYCLGRGLMDIAFNEYHNSFLFKTGQYEKMQSPFAWDLVSRKLVAMAISGIAFFILTLLCEYNFFRKPKRTPVCHFELEEEDEDVANERRRVLRGLAQSDLLRLENLTKVYETSKLGKNLAVDRLCLGVPAGECFGLLGVNGAGKSTTLKMLTGDTSITSGDALLNNFSLQHQFESVQQFIGYCPQFDALYDELTAREHLTMYARFRGIPYQEEKQVVDWALRKLDLVPLADKTSGVFSGGNKRKLSTAIALLGGPPIIFLVRIQDCFITFHIMARVDDGYLSFW